MSTTDGRPHIAYVSRHNPHDLRSWSGTSRYMAKALQKHCGNVTIIDSPPVHGSVYSRLLASVRYAQRVSRELKHRNFDVVFVAHSAAALALQKKTEIPVIFVSDFTWKLFRSYYTHIYTGSWNRNTRTWKWYARDYLEDRALNRSNLLIYPSDWAAQSAERDYRIDRRKIYVVPFGANIDEVPPRDAILRKQISSKCKLLFLGVNWENKGGPIAVETVAKLRDMGIDAELTICGCVPPIDDLHDGVTVTPFLDKTDERDRKRLSNLLSTADFLLLPTRIEGFGIVFCEANAFGVPAITTDAGGVSGAVTQGVNGYMLPVEATGSDYANLIHKLYRDEQAYMALVRSSRQMYEERLNWDAWGMNVCKLMRDLLA